MHDRLHLADTTRVCFIINEHTTKCSRYKHTCYKYNCCGQPKCATKLFEMIRNFQIFDKLVYSDHCALSFALSGHGHLRKNLVYKNHLEKIKTYPAVYNWNPDLLPAYHERLLNTDCINLYDQLLINITGVNLDSGAAVDTFNDYMNTAIGPLFSKRNNNRTGTFPVNAWFDKECKDAKKSCMMEAEILYLNKRVIPITVQCGIIKPW